MNIVDDALYLHSARKQHSEIPQREISVTWSDKNSDKWINLRRITHIHQASAVSDSSYIMMTCISENNIFVDWSKRLPDDKLLEGNCYCIIMFTLLRFMLKEAEDSDVALLLQIQLPYDLSLAYLQMFKVSVSFVLITCVIPVVCRIW